MVQLYIYIGIAISAFWASFTEGRKHGSIGSIIGAIIGACIGLIYFNLSRLILRWILRRIDHAKESTKIYRLILAISLGLAFFIWFCSAYSVGFVISRWIMTRVFTK